MNVNNFLIFIIISLSVWLGAWIYIGGGKNYSGEIIANISSSSQSSDDFELQLGDINSSQLQKTSLNYIQNQIGMPLAYISNSGLKVILNAPHGEFDITKNIGTLLIYPNEIKNLSGYYFEAKGNTYHINSQGVEKLEFSGNVVANNLIENSSGLYFGDQKISNEKLGKFFVTGNILQGETQKFYLFDDGKNLQKFDFSGTLNYISGSTYEQNGQRYIIGNYLNNIIIRSIPENYVCEDIFLCTQNNKVFALYFSLDNLNYYGPANGEILVGVNGENFKYLGRLNNIRYYYNGSNIFVIKDTNRFRKLEKLSNYAKDRFFESCQGINYQPCLGLN